METGILIPEILLPNESVDLKKWSVVACDQFTSEPDYWDELKDFVGDSESTLNITFPEVYLSKENSQIISNINAKMEEYVSNGVFAQGKKGFVLTVRQTGYGKKRIGLVLAVDLEKYSYNPEDKAIIRATEGTILTRIPPRVEIRKNASLELPHIMLLVDDLKNEVITPIFNDRKNLKKVYDFDLNMNGGHIEGYFVDENKAKDVIKSFEKLITDDVLIEKYGSNDKILFAVGDGNHSLATAKTCWENIKQNLSAEEQKEHPSRYALVEVVNLYDEGLEFEPIHRVVFGVKDGFKKGLKKLFPNSNYNCLVVDEQGEDNLPIVNNSAEATKVVQNYIDSAINKGMATEVDYVHGLDSVRKVVLANKNSVGITLPSLNKQDLFKSVIKDGVLPRKTFSMGEATEKRYYLEARKIKA